VRTGPARPVRRPGQVGRCGVRQGTRGAWCPARTCRCWRARLARRTRQAPGPPARPPRGKRPGRRLCPRPQLSRPRATPAPGSSRARRRRPCALPLPGALAPCLARYLRNAGVQPQAGASAGAVAGGAVCRPAQGRWADGEAPWGRPWAAHSAVQPEWGVAHRATPRRPGARLNQPPSSWPAGGTECVRGCHATVSAPGAHNAGGAAARSDVLGPAHGRRLTGGGDARARGCRHVCGEGW